MKKSLAILLTLALLFSLAACGGGGGTPAATKAPEVTTAPDAPETTDAPPVETEDASAGDPADYFSVLKADESRESPEAVQANEAYTIGVLLPMLSNAHFTAQAYGYVSEAEALGVEAIVWDCGGYANFDTQVRQMEDLITMGVDGIILVAADADACLNPINAAFEAGIPVINVNVMANSDNVLKIKSDDTAIGEMEAERIATLLGGEGKVLMVRGTAGTSWAIGRGDGFKAYMEANYPGIEILDELWCANEVDAAMLQVEDAIMAYGDDIQAVYAPGENTGKGAILALKAAGMIDNVPVVACDPSDDSISMILEGSMKASVVQYSVGLGQWGVRAMVNILNGNADQLSKQYWTTLEIVDADNVNTFEFVGFSKAPADWQLAS